jgi:hypothetical protein
MLSPEEAALSTAREQGFDAGQKERFLPLNPRTIAEDKELYEFLSKAQISVSKRGDGIFISGDRRGKIDTAQFRRYGIPIPGCLIIPTHGDPHEEEERIRTLVLLPQAEIAYEEKNKQNKMRESAQKAADEKREERRNHAGEEYEKRMEDLRPFINEYRKIADDYKDSLGAYIDTDPDGNITLRTKRGDSFPVVDMKYDDDVERTMPTKRWGTYSKDAKIALENEARFGVMKDRLWPKIQKVEQGFRESIPNYFVEPLQDGSGFALSNSPFAKEGGSGFYKKFVWSDEDFEIFSGMIDEMISHETTIRENEKLDVGKMSSEDIKKKIQDLAEQGFSVFSQHGSYHVDHDFSGGKRYYSTESIGGLKLEGEYRHFAEEAVHDAEAHKAYEKLSIGIKIYEKITGTKKRVVFEAEGNPATFLRRLIDESKHWEGGRYYIQVGNRLADIKDPYEIPNKYVLNPEGVVSSLRRRWPMASEFSGAAKK